jgi:putative isomerase
VSFNRIVSIVVLALNVACPSWSQPPTKIGSWSSLSREADTIGKTEWRPMLQYVASLHQKSTHPAQGPFQYEWEEIGPGYTYGPAFGHWDIVHQALDVVTSFPQHSLHQLLNDIIAQEPSGLIPGSLWMPGSKLSKEGKVTWNKMSEGHPPVWVFTVNEYVRETGDSAVLKLFYPALIRQITWFENERHAEGEGFFYNDILTGNWESGVDQGVRFDDSMHMRLACVDATSHVYFLYRTAAQWSASLGMTSAWANNRAEALNRFICDSLYVKEDEMFFDRWAVCNDSLRHLTFESMWPIVVGAATPGQANRFIDRYLLDTACFLTKHPIATVGRRDAKFSLRMWRGATWNSMSYWAAVGCLKYGRKDAARRILEQAIDCTAVQFKRTGTIWEFYHPFGGRPEDVARKPKKSPTGPCKDYLGHNPLMAMARLYESTFK